MPGGGDSNEFRETILSAIASGSNGYLPSAIARFMRSTLSRSTPEFSVAILVAPAAFFAASVRVMVSLARLASVCDALLVRSARLASSKIGVSAVPDARV